jgi:L-threonylcarbamoyladenylate synthase
MNKMKETDIQKAVDLLKAGKLVAIPTETVYGLAADASNEQAVSRIFAVKNRPIGHPLIVHVAGYEQLEDWAMDIPEVAYELAKRFWPGPLTLVLKRAPHVLDIVTGAQNSIALRCPKHPMTHEILERFGGGVAAPSANRFGHVSPTCPEHVYDDLGDQVDFIVEGGCCEVGVESTILDLTSDQPRLLRPGILSHEVISEIMGEPVVMSYHESIPTIPSVSGSLATHYAPNTQTVLVSSERLKHFVEEKSRDKKLGVLARQAVSKRAVNGKSVHWITLPDDPKGFARELYAKLRELDALNCDLIVIESVPEHVSWSAVWDRVKRATTRRQSTENEKTVAESC